MIAVDELGHWAGSEVLRVGLLSHVPAGRSLELVDFISVFVPASSMRLTVDASAPGRRYRAQIDGPAVSVLPPCRRLDLEEASPGPLVVLAIDAAFVHDRLKGTDLRICGAPASTDPYLSRLGDLLRPTLKSRVPPPRDYLTCLAEDLREHLSRWYTRRARRQEVRPLAADRLERARALMQASYGDNSLSVERIASHVGLSPFHFTRLFTAATGKAPHAHLTQVRIEEAKLLLGNTCLPIAEIAQRTGYSTHAHFTGMFGRHVGMTPAAWRTHVRGERAEARKAAGT